MNDCCCPPPHSQPERRCPRCRTRGVPVHEATLKALLTEAAMRRFEHGIYHFCPNASCQVVYFAEQGAAFVISDVRVPAWQKQPFGDRMICYCFGETEGAIRDEIRQHGRSAAVDRIRAHIRAKRCACELRNPRGACCLRDVAAAVSRVEEHIEDRAAR